MWIAARSQKPTVESPNDISDSAKSGRLDQPELGLALHSRTSQSKAQTSFTAKRDSTRCRTKRDQCALKAATLIPDLLDDCTHNIPEDAGDERDSQHFGTFGFALNHPDNSRNTSNSGTQKRDHPVSCRHLVITTVATPSRGLLHFFLQCWIEDLTAEAALRRACHDHLTAHRTRLTSPTTRIGVVIATVVVATVVVAVGPG